MTAFDYLRLGGCCFGARGEVFVVAMGSSSCGDTSEGDFEKRLNNSLTVEPTILLIPSDRRAVFLRRHHYQN